MGIGAVLISLAALAGLSCVSIGEMLAPTYDVVVLDHRPDPIYEEFSADYAELCAVSQYRPKEGRQGGFPGHAVMYMKGACLDPDSAYPHLVPCAENVVDPNDPRHGTGISVNKEFKNINWVGIPGKRLFFNGNLTRATILDQPHFDSTVEAALPFFRNVETHSYDLRDAAALEEFVARESVGTDFALRFGRSIFCTRMPLTPKMMQQVMDFLNALNAEYFEGEQDYNWNGFHDNCVHTLRNALAAAKIWKPKKIWTIKLRQLVNVAIPANEAINLATLGNEYPLENFPKIYGDDLKRQTLVEENWLPMGPGVLFESMRIHLRNELYDTHYRLMVAQSPFFHSVTRKANDMFTDARFVELEPNLRYFRERYRTILDSRRESPRWWEPRGEEYRKVRQRYYEMIEQELASVSEFLSSIEAREDEY
jgi:hypothetical protein